MAGAPDTEALPAPARVRAHVASHTPGRVRIRVHAADRDPQTMHAVRERLDGTFGAGRTRIDTSTGSVLVHYNHHAHSAGDVLVILKDIGLVLAEAARGVGLDAPETGGSKTSRQLMVAIGDLDRQLSLLTGRTIDLKLLFPAALGGVGLWRAVTGGLGLSEVPAYVLLWYAFDSFWKFHREATRPPHHRQPAATDSSENSHDPSQHARS